MKNLSIALVFLLAACELQPAPNQAPPPAPPAGSAAPVAPAPHPMPPPTPAVQPTAECEQAGIKEAQLLISDAEPSQKPAMERERADIVRRTEDACTRQGWTAPALACIAQSKTNMDAHACLDKFRAPGAAPAGSAGSGSALHPRGHGPTVTPH